MQSSVDSPTYPAVHRRRNANALDIARPHENRCRHFFMFSRGDLTVVGTTSSCKKRKEDCTGTIAEELPFFSKW
jgi:hypothetical protein